MREKVKFGARLCVAAKVSRSVIDRLSMPPTREDEERENHIVKQKKRFTEERESDHVTHFQTAE